MKKIVLFNLFFLIFFFPSQSYANQNIQRLLSREGYTVGEIDGIIGPKTIDAIVAFQKMHGLPQRDGEIDEETRIAFRHIRSPEQKFYSENDIHLEVSISRQLLYVFENGNIKAIINISTGKEDRTPLGVFTVYQMIDSVWVDAISKTREVQGRMYMPIKFYGPYYIHGSDYVPSYPDSLGCIRVNPWNMYYLHKIVEVGTKIFIY